MAEPILLKVQQREREILEYLRGVPRSNAGPEWGGRSPRTQAIANSE